MACVVGESDGRSAGGGHAANLQLRRGKYLCGARLNYVPSILTPGATGTMWESDRISWSRASDALKAALKLAGEMLATRD